jgi:hypothetical protein
VFSGQFDHKSKVEGKWCSVPHLQTLWHDVHKFGLNRTARYFSWWPHVWLTSNNRPFVFHVNPKWPDTDSQRKKVTWCWFWQKWVLQLLLFDCWVGVCLVYNLICYCITLSSLVYQNFDYLSLYSLQSHFLFDIVMFLLIPSLSFKM